jgi:predicted RNase H-like HicB family nuclease
VGKLGKFAARSRGWQHRVHPPPQWPRPDGEGQGCHPGALRREPRTDTLAVVVEPAEGAWHAHCPTLLDYGAATWGTTREEVLEHIREVARMVLERMAEARMPVPTAPADLVPTPTEQVVVTVCVPPP